MIVTHHDVESGGDGDIARVKKIYNLLKDSWRARLFGFKHFSDERKHLWPILSPFWLCSLTREVLRSNWDFVYCYNQRYLVVFLKFLRSLTHRDYKVIYDAVLTWKLTSGQQILKDLRRTTEQMAGKCADLVVVVSELSEDFFSRFQSTLLIPTLVDVNIFRPKSGKRHEIRLKHKIGDNEKVVGLIGPFDSKINGYLIGFLVDNVGKFDKRIKFIAIGRGFPRNEMKNSNVILAGFVYDYVAYLSAFDAVLVVRKFPTDGAINRIIEAMAMNLPVFANPVAATTIDQATPGHDLFVFDEQEMARRVNKVIFQQKLLEQMGVNARSVVEKHYEMQRFRKDMQEALQSCRNS